MNGIDRAGRPRRFFAAGSFWNTPIAADAPPAEENDRWLELLAWCAPGLHVNLHAWTIPVFPVDAATPRVPMQRRFELLRCGALPPDDEPLEGWSFLRHASAGLAAGRPLGHGPGFGPLVPMPVHAAPDHELDGHLAMVDWDAGWVWDMWGARRLPDGGWCSFTGMRYRLDGDGLFDGFTPRPMQGHSVHLHGPGRASGLPIVAGLIMQHELEAGAIEHKLAFACTVSGEQTHCHPASWTDGSIPGGIPAGAILQLDPQLDPASLGLSGDAAIIARALQRYGAVLCDFAGGATLYGEGAPAHGWSGALTESALMHIPWRHYRILQTPPRRPLGMVCAQHRGLSDAYRRWSALGGREPSA